MVWHASERLLIASSSPLSSYFISMRLAPTDRVSLACLGCSSQHSIRLAKIILFLHSEAAVCVRARARAALGDAASKKINASNVSIQPPKLRHSTSVRLLSPTGTKKSLLNNSPFHSH